MINRITQAADLDTYEKTDIFSVRIKSLINAYGTSYGFAEFYAQQCVGKATAIISRLDGDYTLSAADGADFEELSEFFTALGYVSVLSDNRLTLNNAFSEGAVMITTAKKELHCDDAFIDFYPRLMDIYNIQDYDNVDFEAWYVDLSHRIRHGAAKAYALCRGGDIISSGIFSSIWQDSAVLSSVITAPSYRHCGYGSALVSEMICDIKGSVYIMREKDKNESFYSNLGFVNNGIWRLHK